MINLLLGVPGSGKSYEAVVHHIVESLKEGRRVITNIQLNLDYIYKEHPSAKYLGLISIVSDSLKIDGKLWPPFSHVDFYKDDWRSSNPKKEGQGPLYVIDEAQLAMPRSRTPEDLQNWYQLHRHTGCDVLLITQSKGQVNKVIVDLCQMVFLVNKNVAAGMPSSYSFTIFDGANSRKPIDTLTRRYKSKNFQYYKSHTLSGSSVVEASSREVRNVFFRVPFLLSYFFIGLFIYLLIGMDFGAMFGGGISPSVVSEPVSSLRVPSSVSRVSSSGSSVPSAVVPAAVSSSVSVPVVPIKDTPVKVDYPYDDITLFISSSYSVGGVNYYNLSGVTDNDFVFDVLISDLVNVGFSVTRLGLCSVKLSISDYSRFIYCDNYDDRVNSSRVF